MSILKSPYFPSKTKKKYLNGVQILFFKITFYKQSYL